MGSEFPNHSRFKSSLMVVISILLLLTGAELIAILILNSGHLIFTLDDAYIHLGMAENLLKGHYGINLGEFSSPSSSILWIFLLAPFTVLSFSNYAVLIINLLCELGTLYIYWEIIALIFNSEQDNKTTNVTIVWFLILLIFASNMISLIFMGMEHSLQLLLVTLIIRGLIFEVERGKISWLLVAAIISAPLVRYENFAISLPAIIYLYIRGHRRASFISASTLVLLFGIFTAFLLNFNLSPLPTSVKFKLTTTSAKEIEEPLRIFIEKFTQSPKAVLLMISMLFIVYFSLFKKVSKEKKFLAYIISFGIFLHLIVGKYGSFYRYEIYIFTVAILTILYLYKDNISVIISNNSWWKFCSFLTLLVILFFCTYIKAAILTPIGSNNIYEQQYQMHRFAVDYYKKPVAVNDLGFVAFQNDNYVLDLWGLSSTDALKYRATENSADWMDRISKDHNVKCAMIYDKWFQNIPGQWKKLGTLHLGKIKITPSYSSVSFYSLDENNFDELHELLKKFSTTLPEGAKFNFIK